MKQSKFFLALVLTLALNVSYSQVGIGTTTPEMELHIADADSQILLLENTEALSLGKETAIYFKTGNGSFAYTGGIKTIGTGTNVARLAFFTFAASFPGGLIERMSIQDNGNVGIGITPSEKLEVAGNVKVDGKISGVADPTVDNDAANKKYVDDKISSLPTINTNNSNYGTVVNPVTGKIWLDRNLGATQVATSSTDFASYGDLYQWGRNADGHQTIVWTSSTTSDGAEQSSETSTQASNYFTTGGLFITGSINWLSNVETHMWSGTAAENNPCPSEFRVPTAAEWEQERLSWSSNNAAGAFASPLKLPMAGFRNRSDGSLSFVGTTGYYWSSTVSGANARFLFFNSGNAYMDTFNRANGSSVRCLKD